MMEFPDEDTENLRGEIVISRIMYRKLVNEDPTLLGREKFKPFILLSRGSNYNDGKYF